MMKILVLLFSILLLVSCTGKQLQKTDQKKLFTSNEQVIFDTEKKLFKYEFSINNYSKETITNFAYSVVFKNKKGVAILKPGQYRGSHKLRLHQGKYIA